LDIASVITIALSNMFLLHSSMSCTMSGFGMAPATATMSFPVMVFVPHSSVVAREGRVV
jgi:hypothetical protein